jgi:hypothetical protein
MNMRNKKEEIRNRNKKSKTPSCFFILFLISNILFIMFPAGLSLARIKVQKAQVATDIPTIYPRSSWSNSKYDKRTKEIWPAEYETPEVIIIHHTATNYKSATSKQIKKIYKYHSYTRRWGDIGYNYIIGKDGSIFEGRYGGNGAIGGHSYSNGTNYNSGSIGISVLGNYVGESLSDQSRDSLEKLVGWLAANNGISISSDIRFHNKKLDSAVIGHKDVADTACPGKNIYNNLAGIRSNAASLAAGYQNYAYQVSGESEKFEISGGKRYAGSSRTQIAEISKTQLEAYPSGGAAETNDEQGDAIGHAYPSGTLMKNKNSGNFAVLEGSSLRPIGDEAVLRTGYRDSNAVSAENDLWSQYAAGEAVNFRSGSFLSNQGNYYFIDGNQKRKVDVSSGRLALIDLATAQEASESQLARYSDGTLITSSAEVPSGTILTTNYKSFFYVENARVKKSMTKSVFQASFSNSAAVKVSKKFLQTFKTSGNLPFQSGVVVQYGKKYYFIENGTKRMFQKKSLVSSMGFRIAAVAKRKEMAGIADGPVIE